VRIGKGYLKLSLVSCPVALFPASSEREKISFNQINKKTGNRIRYRKVDAETEDEVDSSDIVKGYEVGKGQYIEIDPEELEAIAIESKRTIEIDEFVPKKEIDELYLNLPRSRRGSRSTGVRGHSGGDPQRRHGSAREGRFHLSRACHRTRTARQRPSRDYVAISV
jgi:Ku70/Ku80 beta-barrel domain